MELMERLKFLLFPIMGIRVVHCIGDSHTSVFEYVRDHFVWKKTKFRFCVVPGATAMGLANPNSKTDALGKWNEYLRQVPRHHSLLFSLGEVDCGFVIWYRANKHGLSVEEQFQRSLGNYTGFIEQVILQGFRSVYVLSAALPTIQDGQEWGEIARLRKEQLTRKEVSASLQDRTKLTLRYNHALRAFCDRVGAVFIDLEAETIDGDTGLIKPRFLNKDPLDFHHDCENVSDVLVPLLKRQGFC